MNNTQLILCGSIAVDRIMSFTGRYPDLIHPDKLHVIALSVMLDEQREVPGGNGANIASVVAQLGEQPVLLGSVGQDARSYVESLSRLGVVTDFIHESHLPTASFSVFTDSDGNQIGGFYPGAMGDTEGSGLDPWYDKNVLVVLSPHDPDSTRSHVDECREHGLRMVYDPGQQSSILPADDLRAGMAAAEILIVNDYELSTLVKVTGMTADQIKSEIPIVVTTHGRMGSVIEGAKLDAPIEIAVANAEKVVDPTGAGDAYRAGFLYGYVRQWPLRECGQLGATVASFVLENQGAQTELSKQKIIDRYAQNFNGEIQL